LSVGPVLMIPLLGNKKCIQNFGLKTSEGKVIRHIGTCSRMILKIIFKKNIVKIMKWMIPAPDRCCW